MVNGMPHSARTSRQAAMASRILAIASSRVDPWLIQPGMEGHSTTHTPSSSRSKYCQKSHVFILASNIFVAKPPAQPVVPTQPTGLTAAAAPPISPSPPDYQHRQIVPYYKITPTMRNTPSWSVIFFGYPFFAGHYCWPHTSKHGYQLG
jgi:hypothetical protein